MCIRAPGKAAEVYWSSDISQADISHNMHLNHIYPQHTHTVTHTATLSVVTEDMLMAFLNSDLMKTTVTGDR